MRVTHQSEETVLGWPIERRDSYVHELNSYYEALNRKN
jgi:hypothetical protein